MRKFILSLLLMLICIPVYAKDDNKFYYDNEKVEDMWITKINSEQTRSANPYIIKRRSDNAYVYCLEPFVLLQNDVTYTYENDPKKYGLTQEQLDRINLIIYYGYGYGNHTGEKWYGVTQYMIWKEADKKADIYFTSTKGGAKKDLYKNEINEIESLIKEHNEVPNFKSVYNVLLGEDLVIESNINLSNYDIESDAKYTIKDNKLYFSNLSNDSYNIKLSKHNKRYENDFRLYHNVDSQNVIVPGNSGIYNKEYSFKITTYNGEVKINKRDKNNTRVGGAIYGVYKGSELVKKVTTSSTDTVSISLPSGSYTLKELEAPIGYKLDNKVYSFEINKDNLVKEFNLVDDIIQVKVNINKEDSNTHEKLVGATYGIYKSDKLISKVTTNEDGIATIELPFGEYTLKELEAPIGYKLDDKVYNFKVSEDKEQFIDLLDDKILVKVIINKESSSTHEKLVGATYGIYKSDKLISKVTTNKDGIATIELPFGEYTLKELEAPKGYKLDSKIYNIDINSNDDKVINLTDDMLIIKVPDTLLRQDIHGFIFIVIGLIGLLYGKKKYFVH